MELKVSEYSHREHSHEYYIRNKYRVNTGNLSHYICILTQNHDGAWVHLKWFEAHRCSFTHYAWLFFISVCGGLSPQSSSALSGSLLESVSPFYLGEVFHATISCNSSLSISYSAALLFQLLSLSELFTFSLYDSNDSNAMLCAAEALSELHRGVVLVACLRALSPMLQTLTQSFSDDTVASLVIGKSVGERAFVPISDVRNPSGCIQFRLHSGPRRMSPRQSLVECRDVCDCFNRSTLRQSGWCFHNNPSRNTVSYLFAYVRYIYYTLCRYISLYVYVQTLVFIHHVIFIVYVCVARKNNFSIH